MPISLWIIVLAAVNIAAYFLMWQDKQRAIRQQWRISDAYIIAIELAGWIYRDSFRQATFSP